MTGDSGADPVRDAPDERAGTEAPDRPVRPAVLLAGVAKRFGWTWALRGLDLRVEKGIVLALMGPNGAGKTTLLRILATLIHPTEGDVRVLGRPLPDRSEEVRRAVGFLAPEDYLYDQLTALENLRFACLMSGIRREEDELRSVLDRVGLARVAEIQVDGYSSGMRKRLALARLLLRDLELLLLDEPYGRLDTDGMELVDEIVAGMKAAGRTVILASHRWGRTLRTVDRLAVLERGALAWLGDPRDYDPGAGRGAR